MEEREACGMVERKGKPHRESGTHLVEPHGTHTHSARTHSHFQKCRRYTPDSEPHTHSKVSHLELNRGISYHVTPLHLVPAQTSQPITFVTLQACAVRTCEGHHGLTRRRDSALMLTRQSALDSCYSAPCQPYYKQDVI